MPDIVEKAQEIIDSAVYKQQKKNNRHKTMVKMLDTIVWTIVLSVVTMCVMLLCIKIGG